MTAATCLWCERGFPKRESGGKVQVFCSPRCRRAFDHAARAYVRRAVEMGTLTVRDLQNALAATRALLPEAMSPPPVPRGSDGPRKACTLPTEAMSPEAIPKGSAVPLTSEPSAGAVPP